MPYTTYDAPLCDIDPTHGAMHLDPCYKTLNPPTILCYGWFCHVDGCDGFGGTIEKSKVKTDDTKGKYHAKRTTRKDVSGRIHARQGSAETEVEGQLAFDLDLP